MSEFAKLKISGDGTRQNTRVTDANGNAFFVSAIEFVVDVNGENYIRLTLPANNSIAIDLDLHESIPVEVVK